MTIRENKALIRVGYSCNNNCVFCHLGSKRNENLTTLEIKKKIILCKKEGYNFVVLSGGEPTIRKDILEIARFIKKNRMRLGLITNGRMLSYDPFLKELIKNNLGYVYISLLGSKKNIHNQITHSNSFDQTIKGIKNIVKYKSVEHKVNVTVISKNIDNLKNIVDLAKKIKIRKLKFSSVDCKGNTLKSLDMVPDLSLAIRKIKESVDYSITQNIQPYISDFPLCLIGKYNKYIDNLETNKIEVMSEVFENRLYPIDHNDKVKPPCCMGCEKYGPCLGIDKNYFKVKGDKEIKRAKKIGNSVLYILTKESKNINCKNVPKNVKKMVLHNKDYKIYECHSDNFTKKQIDLLKERDQVYNLRDDLPKKEFLNLIKLKQYPRCNKCKSRHECSRIFMSDNKKVFQEYFSNLKRELKNLKGKVLDIGCGDIYFKDVFLELVKNKRIDYLGLDPKKNTNKKLKTIQSNFEDYKSRKNYFDNILVLGSYNHILDINLALKKIKEYLKTNGLLIISDNESFIILKDKKNLDHPKKEFEHYRNASIGEVKEKLIELNFKVMKEIPVNKETCNQWLIVAKNKKIGGTNG